MHLTAVCSFCTIIVLIHLGHETWFFCVVWRNIKMVVFSHSIAVYGMLGGILTLHIAAGTTNTNGLEIPTESEETTILIHCQKHLSTMLHINTMAKKLQHGHHLVVRLDFP